MKNSIIYLIVFLGLQAAAGLVVNAVWKAVTGSADMTVYSLITSTVLFSILTIAVFLLAHWTEVSPRWLRSRQWFVLFWSIMAAIGLILPSAWLQEQIPELPNFVKQQFEDILGNRWGYLSIGLLAPLVEEMVFRGAILRSLLRQQPVWVAVAISSLLFAVAHLNPAQMPHAFVVGLLLGWMYWRTGSILPGLAYHWTNNTVAYVLYNLFPVSDMKVADLFGGSTTHVVLALFFSLMIFLPALYQLNVWMRHADE